MTNRINTAKEREKLTAMNALSERNDWYLSQIDAERAENERLRKALESCPPTSNPTVTADYHLERINAWWKNTARAALNPEDEE